MFQFCASVADSGPVLSQYCVFGMDSRNLFNLTITITVAIPFKHNTSTQCCFNVGLASQTVIQNQVNRETSKCVYWALSKIPVQNGRQKTPTRNSNQSVIVKIKKLK